MHWPTQTPHLTRRQSTNTHELSERFNVLTHPNAQELLLRRGAASNQSAIDCIHIWCARTAQLVQTCEEVSQSQRNPTTYSPAFKVAGTRTSSSMAVLWPI